MNLDGKAGEFRLFAPDFPDWIEDDGVGIKLAPDQRTTTIMKTVLNDLENKKELYKLFEQIHGDETRHWLDQQLPPAGALSPLPQVVGAPGGVAAELLQVVVEGAVGEMDHGRGEGDR